jgi:hypothetical protein
VPSIVFNPEDTEGSGAILRLLGIFSSTKTPRLQSTLAIANPDPTPIWVAHGQYGTEEDWQEKRPVDIFRISILSQIQQLPGFQALDNSKI